MINSHIKKSSIIPESILILAYPGVYGIDEGVAQAPGTHVQGETQDGLLDT